MKLNEFNWRDVCHAATHEVNSQCGLNVEVRDHGEHLLSIIAREDDDEHTVLTVAYFDSTEGQHEFGTIAFQLSKVCELFHGDEHNGCVAIIEHLHGGCHVATLGNALTVAAWRARLVSTLWEALPFDLELLPLAPTGPLRTSNISDKEPSGKHVLIF